VIKSAIVLGQCGSSVLVLVQHNTKFINLQYMRKKSPKEIKAEVQERIEEINKEIGNLIRERRLYQSIIEELGEDHQSEPQSSTSDSEISIEIIPEQKSRHTAKKTQKGERQIAFKKARAWALDRKRNKKNK
jgi:hypothetical protein